MDKVKYEKAKELEIKIALLNKITDAHRFGAISSQGAITTFPGFVEDKLNCKIIELIKNEISLLEEEFNSL